VEPDPLGQPADDQGDLRPAAGLPLPLPGRRAGRSRRQPLKATALVLLGVLLVAAAADAARVRGTRHADLVQTVNNKRDIVSCGRGHDVATVDGRDRVARDCEVVTREISRDPYRRDGRHATEVEPDTASWGSTVVAAFQVGRVFDGGAANIGFATSRDSGRTWKHGFLPKLTPSSKPAGPWPRATDPTVAYDAAHGAWLIVSLTFGGPSSALVVSRSPDGLHWQQPVTAIQRPGFVLDKQWVACDNWPSSPFRGRCYLSYDDFQTNEIETYFSQDGGLTWIHGAAVPGAGREAINGPAAPGVQPIVLPSGVVLLPYFDNTQISELSSVDGGVTWQGPTPIAAASYRSYNDLRTAPLPSAEVGGDGTAYVAWSDCSRRRNCAVNDVLVARSTDGLTWSRPVRASKGSADKELPGIAADPSRPGRVALAYYSVSGRKLNVALVSSRDAGAHWSGAQRLNSCSVPFGWVAPATGGAMVGDYISTSFAGGRAVPVFALAFRPRRGRLHESMFATSRPVR